MALEEDLKHKNLRDAADDVSRFRDYADADADLFWELDPNFRFAIVSLRREGRSSVREYDLLGKTPWQFADADPDRDPVWAAFVDKLQRRVPFRDFRICLRQEGVGLAYWRFSGKPVVTADGMFFGYRGVASDDTVDTIRRTHLENQAGDYQAMLESLGVGVAYFDDRQRLSLCNAVFRQMVPVPGEHVKPGMSFDALMHFIQPLLAQEQTKTTDTVAAPDTGPISWHFQNGRRLTGDIRVLPSGCKMLSVHDASHPSGAGTIMDTFYDVMLESRQAFLTHVKGRLVFANQAVAEIFGCQAADMVGHDVWNFIHPEDRSRLRLFNETRFEGGFVPTTYMAIGQSMNGDTLHLEFNVQIGSWRGQRAVQVFLKDHTLVRKAELALSESEAKFRNLVEGSLQGLFVHRDMQILYANTPAAMIYGYDVDEFVGLNAMNLVSAKDRGLVDENIRRRLAGDPDVPERYEIIGVRKDGSQVALEVFSRIVDWEGGAAIQVTLLDISGRKEIERHLLDAKDAAEHADRTKTEFLANMSHELRTPLNAIIGFSQLIRDKIMGELNSHYVDYANSIHASGMHLLSVVNDLLDVASIESGALSLNEDEVEIGDVIRSCERMLRPRAQKAELLISVDVPEQGLVLRADARRMKQILINLVNNAIKFTKVGGHVIVRAYCNAVGQPVLEVEDNGIGISEQDQEIIFEAFVRVNSAFVAQREGTGLGLPLVHALTTLHGGEIHLESAFGVGTKIAVILPKERLLASSA